MSPQTADLHETFDTKTLPLPIDAVLQQLLGALQRGHTVLRAPTGSGKSTKVPLALLDAPWLADKGILMLEPRRAAVRMTAARMAAQLGEPLGERVGYQIRFERRGGQQTRIEVVTEGIMTRRIQSDPGLEDYGLIVFDEFHERNLHSDLGLALALDVVSNLRPELRLLVMSATLDAEPIIRLLGDASLVDGEGRTYPVQIIHAERPSATDPVRSMISGIRRALVEQEGDILAFLPGTGEIDRCVEQLAPLSAAGILVLPLHGRLPTAAQDRALNPGEPGRRRVIIATDIAETSLTIPGIRVVVDGGLTRKPRFDPGSGLTRLVTEPIPRASADQRAGRAGRLAPGTCYRLWTRQQEQGRPDHRTPEILQADLAPLVLELVLWGVKDPASLGWMDPPPKPAWDQATAMLRTLGALDSSHSLTPLGRAMAELPLHPRLAALMCGAASSARLLAADLCALISERDPLLWERGQRRPADLGVRLQALAAMREQTAAPGMDRHRLAAVERVARQLLRLAGTSPAEGATTAGALLALAYPDRIAQRRDRDSDRYRLASGAGAVLPLEDPLAVHPYLVVADLDARGRDGRIQLALPISESELADVLGARITTAREVFWDASREAVAVRETRRFGALLLNSHPCPLDASEAIADLLLNQVRERFEQALNWTGTARQLQARIALLRAHDPKGCWPDFSTHTLRATLDDWLGPWLAGKSRLAEVRDLDLAAILTGRLSWDQRQRLEGEAPSVLVMPAGNRRTLDYVSSEVPILAVPLQELFGLTETPAICGGRIPVLLHLLSPARRPIQVTQDLAGFWARGYAEVRKELRGRYPKHHWPEDPTQAQAVAGGLRRRTA